MTDAVMIDGISWMIMCFAGVVIVLGLLSAWRER